MVKAYRGFAFAIMGLVVVQAMAIAYGMAGLYVWVDEDGGVLDKVKLDDAENLLTFRGSGGFAIHGINGTMIIPLVVIVFVILSFFAKVEEGVKRALILFAMVAVQITLGIFGHVEPLLGPLHALNGFGIFMFAYLTGKRASPATVAA
jgi:heme A synthase